MLPPLDETPMVSVMTLAYNHERFVAEAIESVLGQDWPRDRLEYLVINDGSTDGTAAAIEPYRDYIRYIDKPNEGLRATVNRAMEQVSGDVITAVAGDDAFLPGRIRVQVDALRANPRAGLVYTDAHVVNGDNAGIHVSFMRGNGLEPRSGRIQGSLLERNVVSGGAVMLRGDLKHRYHPIPPHAAWEDYWWAWAVSEVAEVVYLPVPTYLYRMHGQNMALGIEGEKLRRAQREELRFRRWMLQTIGPSRATTVELVCGLISFCDVVSSVALDLDVPRSEVLETTDAQRAQAAEHAADAASALRDDDVPGTAIGCARALAADPDCVAALRLLSQLAAGAPDPAHDLGTRGRVVLTDADGLVADPALLRAYADQVAADDDVTLLIHADGWTPERMDAELPALLSQVGLDGDDAPDMLALGDVRGGRAALRRRADATLGPVPGAERLPAFDADLIATAP